MSWHECSKQVLGVENSVHKKYNNYEQAHRYYNAYVGAALPLRPLPPSPMLILDDCCETIAPQGGKTCSWKNVMILSLLVLVFGLWMRLSMSSKCKCNN
jgi:hypothetical protein